MKYFLLYLVITLGLLSCTKPENEKIVLYGEFKNSKEIDSVYLNVQGVFEEVLHSAKLSKEGVFIIKIDKEFPGFYDFRCGDFSCEMFLSPGDSLYVNADLSDFNKSLTFKGIGSENNMAMLTIKRSTPTVSPEITYALDEKAFSAFNDSLLNARNNWLSENSARNSNITSTFVEAQKNVHLYRWANNYLLYPSYHAYYGNQPDFKPSDKFSSYLKKINFNDTTLLGNSAYTRFITSYFQVKLRDEVRKDSSLLTSRKKVIEKIFELFRNEVKVQKTLAFLKYNILLNVVNLEGTKEIKPIVEQFITETENKIYKNKLISELNKWKNCEPGMELKNYRFSDIHGKEFLFSNYKGKIIYIDVWASWCGPCIAEIPYLKKLEEKFRNSKIVFVSISIDENKLEWEKSIKTEKLGGIQLWAEGWKHQFCSDFNINSIPRFILIDSQGLIYDNNAVRPSGKIDAKISELLKAI
ncbi:MAG: TlpA disulfide reductase family protein [Bacteroidales bacterium]